MALIPPHADLPAGPCPRGAWLWTVARPGFSSATTFSGGLQICTSPNLIDLEAFGLMMDLAMMAAGTRQPFIRTALTLSGCRCCRNRPGDRERQRSRCHRPQPSAQEGHPLPAARANRVTNQVGDHPPRLGGQLPALAGTEQRHQLQRRCCDHGERGSSPNVRQWAKRSRASRQWPTRVKLGRSSTAGCPRS